MNSLYTSSRVLFSDRIGVTVYPEKAGFVPRRIRAEAEAARLARPAGFRPVYVDSSESFPVFRFALIASAILSALAFFLF